MQKIIVVVMGDNCSKFLDMCFKSIIESNKIIFCWGEEDKETLNKYNEWKTKYPEKFEVIRNYYNQDDKEMNGKQRNFYLDYLKENYPNDWVLCVDADEVVDDLSKIKEFIQTARPLVYSVKMRHFQQDLGHEDATVDKHWVPNRLFKISEADKYPLGEHPVLLPKSYKERPFSSENCLVYEASAGGYFLMGYCDVTTIWHLAYVPNLWDIKKRYDNHMKKSEMHSPEFLKWWYHNHIFGSYPKKEINKEDISKVILDGFGIDKDEIYFAKRIIDLKHPMMVQQWNDYFKPESVLDLGCGRGCYLYFWNWFTKCSGIEISEWARNNSFIDKAFIRLGHVTSEECYTENDLITAIDILEHLSDVELDMALRHVSKYGKKFLFSIPFVGNPNLTSDKTHKQHHDKQWWVDKISLYGIKVKETPSNWLFSHQMIIGEKEVK